MTIPKKKKLTNDPEVRQEIERYKWIEFEMHGVSLGFVRAAKEWIAHCSRQWLKVYVVARKLMRKKLAIKKPGANVKKNQHS